MLFIRPSLVLEARLQPQDYSQETAREIRRSYNFIASSAVREVGEEEVGEGNVMRFHIRLMKPYWDTADPAAQELWEAVMPRWLHNQALNVTTAMNRYNMVSHPAGATNVAYDWADFEFNDHATLRVKLNPDNTLAADVVELAEAVRKLANAGAFGEEKPALIRVPSKESIAAQEAAYEALKQQVEEAKAAAAAAAAAAEAEAAEIAEAPALAEEPVAKAALIDAPAPAEEASDVVVIDSGALKQQPLTKPEPEPAAPAPEVPELPPFALDFSVWGLEFADGRMVEFDSATA